MLKPIISVRHLGFLVDQQWLLQDISFEVQPGTFTIIMGMNGAGKSTLLKLLSGIHHPSTGEVLLEGQSLCAIQTNQLALKRAVLTQQQQLSFNMTAEEVTMMGRYPYIKPCPSPLDKEIVQNSMQRMGITHLAKRYYHTLSGGEAQKVQMSRVLSQIGSATADNPKILLLDEPVSHLDIQYQYQFLDVTKQLTNEYVTVIAVLHDINLAIRYADHILFLKKGQLVHKLEEPASINSNIIQDVFGIHTSIISHPETHDPVILVSPTT
ncbi:heme ABC transporter ATP-binding protein [Asinibacterium sp. OR53]|uniref:heme ABC transporter ATP-binding protein n=1 Tax=Asinibacterium sp. OR53 TaxID=925409 RepID=UPI0004ACB0EB|nr:heme ABC transporter ATP-binding protein [Asinibacterium sp. OR53]